LSLTAAPTNTAKQTILGPYPSMNGSRAITGVRPIRTMVMMFGRVHIAGDLPEVLDHALADRLEGVEHPLAGQGHRLEVGRALDPLPVLLEHQVLALVVRVGQEPLAGGIGDRPARVERRLELGDRRG